MLYNSQIDKTNLRKSLQQAKLGGGANQPKTSGANSNKVSNSGID